MTTQTLIDPNIICDDATIVRARFGRPSGDAGQLGLTLKLSSARGTTIVVYGDLTEILELLDAFGVMHPDELTGRKAQAEFSARRFVRIRPADG